MSPKVLNQVEAVKAAAIAVGRFLFAPRYKVIEAESGRAITPPLRDVFMARRFVDLMNWQYGAGTVRLVYA